MKHMMYLILCVGVLGFNNLIFASESENFQVIAHVSIPYSSLTKEDLSNLFLKKITRWKETNKFVYPVDLFEDSPVRRQFSEEIHGKEVAAIKAYWQQQIFSGREIPPLERDSDQDVLQYVEQKAGAIGYVSKSVDITQYNIKVIEIVEGNQK